MLWLGRRFRWCAILEVEESIVVGRVERVCVVVSFSPFASFVMFLRLLLALFCYALLCVKTGEVWLMLLTARKKNGELVN